jgi:hypothetical protein
MQQQKEKYNKKRKSLIVGRRAKQKDYVELKRINDDEIAELKRTHEQAMTKIKNENDKKLETKQTEIDRLVASQQRDDDDITAADTINTTQEQSAYEKNETLTQQNAQLKAVITTFKTFIKEFQLSANYDDFIEKYRTKPQNANKAVLSNDNQKSDPQHPQIQENKQNTTETAQNTTKPPVNKAPPLNPATDKPKQTTKEKNKDFDIGR